MSNAIRKAIGALLALAFLAVLILPAAVAEGDVKPHANELQQVVSQGGLDGDGGWQGDSTDGVWFRETIAPVVEEGHTLENVFDVTAEVVTKEEVEMVTTAQHAAVVISLDLSASMNTGTRIADMKTAVRGFIETYANSAKDDECRYLAIVIFGQYAYRIVDWTDVSDETNRTTVLGALTGVNTAFALPSGVGGSFPRNDGGYTNLSGALLLSHNLLGNLPTEISFSAHSGDKNIYNIVFTDGLPTAKFGRSNGNHTSPLDYSSSTEWIDYGSLAANPTIPGTNYTSGNTEVQIIGAAIESTHGATNMAVAYDSSTEVLKKFVTDAHLKQANDADALKLVFEHFSDTVTTSSEPWSASFPLCTPYQFVCFTDTDGPHSAIIEYKDNKINWDLLSEPIPTPTPAPPEGINDTPDGGTTYYSYSRTFRVTLDTLAVGFVQETSFDVTQEGTDLTSSYLFYKPFSSNIDNVNFQYGYFEVPSTKGYAADLTFTKIISGSEDDAASPAGFVFSLTHSEDCEEPGCNHADAWFVEEISDKAGAVTFTDIPSGHTYTITEVLTEEQAPLYTEPDSVAAGVHWGTSTTDGLTNGTSFVNTVKRTHGSTPPPESTPTQSPEPTLTPEPTPTSSPEPTPTASPEPTPTSSPEPTPTSSPEPTPTSSPEPTPTGSSSSGGTSPRTSPAPSPSPTPTSTPPPPDDAGNGPDRTEEPPAPPEETGLEGRAVEPAPPDELSAAPEPIPTIPSNTLVQVDDAYVEYDGEGVPLGEWHWDEELEDWVFDEYPPLDAPMPFTGGGGVDAFLFIGLLLLGIGLILAAWKPGAPHDKHPPLL